MDTGRIATNDGVSLNYFEDGAGPPLVLIHGWSQSGALFRHQIESLRSFSRVIALELRGHGRSDRPGFGYNVARLSKDLDDALNALGLNNCALLGHSMGCAVIWSYIELFGTRRLSKLLFVDQPPAMMARPQWSAQEREDAGCVFDIAQVQEICDGLRSPFHAMGYVDGMLTGQLTEVDRRWLGEENRLFPRKYAADLFFELCLGDWRNLISTIRLPTLVVGGRVSSTPWRSQEWIHKAIPGSDLRIFEKAEGGGHLMFLENAGTFNHVVSSFLLR
jgi:pimeloyl-ACP methyl ester carboxylesterase